MNKINNKTKLIIFDCDGTLVNSEDLHAEATSELLSTLGLTKYTAEYIRHNLTGFCMHDLFAIIEKEIGKNFSTEQITKQAQDISRSLIKTKVTPIKNMIKLLENINIAKCVASNGNRDSVLTSLETTKILPFFNEKNIFTIECVKSGKPNPEIFLHAAKNMGFEPQNCLVIEDSVVGVKAAKAAQMRVAVYIDQDNQIDHHVKQIKSLEPDFIFHDPLEINNYIL